MFYRWLANGLMAAHLAYVLFVVLGLFSIYLGRLLGWRWVHNRWFRCIHFLMIAVVAFEAIFNLACPLTTWEGDLRRRAGDEVSAVSFVERIMEPVLRPDLPQWAFPLLHIGFALIVLSTFFIVPVCWRPNRERPAELGESKA
jgi:hypothetical protein